MGNRRERGITITSAATTAFWNCQHCRHSSGVDFTLKINFLRVLDGAGVVFDGIAGRELQSDTVLRQADGHNAPRTCFVYKMDQQFDRNVQTMIDQISCTPLPILLPMRVDDSIKDVYRLVSEKSLAVSVIKFSKCERCGSMNARPYPCLEMPSVGMCCHAGTTNHIPQVVTSHAKHISAHTGASTDAAVLVGTVNNEGCNTAAQHDLVVPGQCNLRAAHLPGCITGVRDA